MVLVEGTTPCAAALFVAIFLEERAGIFVGLIIEALVFGMMVLGNRL